MGQKHPRFTTATIELYPRPLTLSVNVEYMSKYACTCPHRTQSILLLKLMRHISIINIPIRVSTKLHPKFSKAPLATPSLESKRPCHVRPVQQSTTGPDLAVVRPSLRHPINLRMVLAKLLEHDPWAGGSLALQEAGLQPGHKATADEHESDAALLGFLDEVDFALGQGVCNFVGSHQSDVQWRA